MFREFRGCPNHILTTLQPPLWFQAFLVTIYTHALKVVNPLSGCLFPAFTKRDYDRAGLGETQVLYLERCIGLWPFSIQRNVP